MEVQRRRVLLMRLSASPEIKFQVRPDLSRNRVTVRMGALNFTLARGEAIELAKAIIGAFDHLLAADVDKLTGRQGAR